MLGTAADGRARWCRPLPRCRVCWCRRPVVCVYGYTPLSSCLVGTIYRVWIQKFFFGFSGRPWCVIVRPKSTTADGEKSGRKTTAIFGGCTILKYIIKIIFCEVLQTLTKNKNIVNILIYCQQNRLKIETSCIWLFFENVQSVLAVVWPFLMVKKYPRRAAIFCGMCVRGVRARCALYTL